MTLPPRLLAPRAWQMFRWLRDPLKFLDECAERYGSHFLMNLVGLNMAIVSDPKAIADLLALDPSQFTSGSSNSLLEPLVGSSSILLLDDQAHRRQRKLLLPPFHGERMIAYGQLICDLTRQQAANWQSGQAIGGRQLMQTITLKTILQAVFGLVAGDRYAQIQRLTATILDLLGSPIGAFLLFNRPLQKDWGPWSPWGRFLAYRSQLDELLYAEIADRQAAQAAGGGSDRTDILSLLLAARDEAGQPMTPAEIRDELITLLLAGHETTATSLSWALWWLTQNPAMADRIRQEIAALGDRPEPTAIARLPYLNAFCQETLRLYPVAIVLFPRSLTQPVTIGNQTYPAGISLFGCTYLVHRRPELYPNPEQFRPERFLERSFTASEFMPFGGGSRSCIGMAFAQFEMKLVLATLLMDWDLSYAGLVPPVPTRRGVTVGPSGPIRLRVTRREPLP